MTRPCLAVYVWTSVYLEPDMISLFTRVSSQLFADGLVKGQELQDMWGKRNEMTITVTL